MSLSTVDLQAFPKIVLKAEREVAHNSPDHTSPWGTKRDNSTNKRFNEKMYRLYSEHTQQLKILDLGCSGGGFVLDCLEDNCLAVGVEGSDYSKRYKRAEWATIPEFLFTCDITADFTISTKSKSGLQPLKFDVVTAWEVIEHIAETDLPRVASNVRKHLAPQGLWIMSVSAKEEVIEGVRLHQTVFPKGWWVKRFSELGFTHLERFVRYFNTQFVRAPKYGAPGSFHLVLSPDPANVPSLPKYGLREYLFDRWLGSHYQLAVRRWILGQ